jgi:multisubunit Na+/H+ antiporter MnhB subunit
MTAGIQHQLRAMRVGIVFALLALLYSFVLGLVFGAAEDKMKQRLADSASRVSATVYQEDAVLMKSVLDKSWAYMKRAHLHAGSMGAIALVLSLLLAHCHVAPRISACTSAALGLGALGYSIYWMWAGFRAPGLGSTGAARESLDWLAIPTSGAFTLAAVAVLVFFLRWTWKPAEAAREPQSALEAEPASQRGR